MVDDLTRRKTMGRVLAGWREDAGLTPRQASEALGLYGPVPVSAIEIGRASLAPGLAG